MLPSNNSEMESNKDIEYETIFNDPPFNKFDYENKIEEINKIHSIEIIKLNHEIKLLKDELSKYNHIKDKGLNKKDIPDLKNILKENKNLKIKNINLEFEKNLKKQYNENIPIIIKNDTKDIKKKLYKILECHKINDKIDYNKVIQKFHFLGIENSKKKFEKVYRKLKKLNEKKDYFSQYNQKKKLKDCKKRRDQTRTIKNNNNNDLYKIKKLLNGNNKLLHMIAIDLLGNRKLTNFETLFNDFKTKNKNINQIFIDFNTELIEYRSNFENLKNEYIILKDIKIKLKAELILLKNNEQLIHFKEYITNYLNEIQNDSKKFVQKLIKIMDFTEVFEKNNEKFKTNMKKIKNFLNNFNPNNKLKDLFNKINDSIYKLFKFDQKQLFKMTGNRIFDYLLSSFQFINKNINNVIIDIPTDINELNVKNQKKYFDLLEIIEFHIKNNREFTVKFLKDLFKIDISPEDLIFQLDSIHLSIDNFQSLRNNLNLNNITPSKNLMQKKRKQMNEELKSSFNPKIEKDSCVMSNLDEYFDGLLTINHVIFFSMILGC
jgi:hypothetical protein